MRHPSAAAALAAAALAVAAAALLAGCSERSGPRLAGAASGTIAGGATGNPLIGFAVGVATDAAAHAILQYTWRARHQAEQDEIAAVAGSIPPGAHAPWAVAHSIRGGDAHGEVLVVRAIGNPLAPCREIAFTMADGQLPDAPPGRRWYRADICRRDGGGPWKWASAEPATGRWGYLQ